MNGCIYSPLSILSEAILVIGFRTTLSNTWEDPNEKTPYMDTFVYVDVNHRYMYHAMLRFAWKPRSSMRNLWWTVHLWTFILTSPWFYNSHNVVCRMQYLVFKWISKMCFVKLLLALSQIYDSIHWTEHKLFNQRGMNWLSPICISIEAQREMRVTICMNTDENAWPTKVLSGMNY